MLTLNMNKVGVVDAEKREETFEGHELGKDFLKDNFGENKFPG